MDWVDGQGLGKGMIRKLAGKTSQKYVEDLSKWAKDVKTLVSHVNVHQKVTSAEEKFNDQVDRMIHFVDS